MKEQEASLIYLPIELNKQDIDSSINQLIQGVVYEDTKMDDDGLMLKAEKREPISVTIDSQTFNYRVPLVIFVKKDIGLTQVEADGAIALIFSSKYEIGEDWSLKTETEVVDFQWLEKPKIKLALFDIPIKFVANKILERSKDFISKSIDQQLAQTFNLRNHTENAWNLLQQPIHVSKDLDLWVKIIPEVLSIAPFQFDGSNISSKIYITAKTNAFFGDKPDAEHAVGLPPFLFEETENDHFKVQVGSAISLLEVQRLAKKYLIGKSYDLGSRSVVLDDLDISSQADKLIVNVQLKGSYNGSINMIGKPVYNKNTNKIEVEDLEYELKTKNIFMKSIGWLFQKGIENLFEKALQFPLNENLIKAKSLLEKQLQDYEFSKNVLINGEIESIEVQDIYLVDDRIEALILANGKLRVDLKFGSPSK